jgi:hypothetical protein
MVVNVLFTGALNALGETMVSFGASLAHGFR